MIFGFQEKNPPSTQQTLIYHLTRMWHQIPPVWTCVSMEMFGAPAFGCRILLVPAHCHRNTHKTADSVVSACQLEWGCEKHACCAYTGSPTAAEWRSPFHTDDSPAGPQKRRKMDKGTIQDLLTQKADAQASLPQTNHPNWFGWWCGRQMVLRQMALTHPFIVCFQGTNELPASHVLIQVGKVVLGASKAL